MTNLALISNDNAPYLTAYDTTTAPWTKLANPVTPPPSYGRAVDFNHDGTRALVAHSTSPGFSAYDTTTAPWTKLPDPALLPSGTCRGAAFNHDGTRAIIAHQFSPFLTAYDTTTTPWTKLLDPALLPTGRADSAAFSGDGSRALVGHANSPFLTAYDTTTTPWTKLSDPTSLPFSNGTGVTFSPDGNYAVISHFGTHLSIYDTATTPWTRLPFTLIGGSFTSADFSPDGSRLVVSSQSTPYVEILDTTVWPWTRFPAPSIMPSGLAHGAAFNHDGTRALIAHATSPFLTAYDTTTTPWTKLANPPLPSSVGTGAAFSRGPSFSYTRVTRGITNTNDDAAFPLFGANPNYTTLQVGDSSGDGLSSACSFRFLNIVVPQSANISSATLRLNRTAFGGWSVIGRWRAIASDNAPALTKATTLDAAKTDSFVEINAGTIQTYTITDLVSEVVNRPGWASGNALTIHGDVNGFETGYVRFTDYSADAALSATITITYSEGEDEVELVTFFDSFRWLP